MPNVAWKGTNLPVVRETKKDIPGLKFIEREIPNGQGTGTQKVLLPQSDPYPVRFCNSCQLQTTCPEFRQGSDCAYRLPVSVRTMEQLQSWTTLVLEWQEFPMAHIGEGFAGGNVRFSIFGRIR